GLSAQQEADQSLGMIIDVKPVSYIAAAAIDRQRLALDRIQDSEWNELLRKLKWTIVVRAVRHDDRKVIGLEPGMGEMVRRSLARRIRRTRPIRRLFTETAVGAKRTIDFVRRYMNESEPGLLPRRQTVVILLGCLQ